MTHLGYIVAAYLAAAIVLIGMVAAVTLDLARQKRRLARLEAEGKRRRSEVSR
jgi:heme exporter protein CcmD